MSDVVVFGGTFEYPHAGHAACVRELLKKYRLVLVAPTSQNPFKERQTFPLEHRVAMLKLLLVAEGIPLAEDRFGTGALVLNFAYVRSRELVEHWWSLTGTTERIAWAIGPDLVDEVKTWSGGWMMGNVDFEVLPSQGEHRSTLVREGKAQPHPAIAAYLREHGLLAPIAS